MADDNWSDDDSPAQHSNSGYRGGGRGSFGGRGGGGGGRGRGGGYRGFHQNDDDHSSGRRNWNDGGSNLESRGPRGRGSVGRFDRDHGGGGDQWGEKRSFGSGQNGNGEEERPRERYIPPEPSNEERDIFGSNVTVGINFDKYEDIKVKVSGENPVPPASSFTSCGLRDFVLGNIKKSGYTRPTPVQKHAIPIIVAGRDLMACAQTGSGKTAAFLVPIINTLLDQPQDAIMDSEGVQPQAVILSPTRELTKQIFDEARKFAHGSILKVCIAYGGTATFHQAQTLMRGCHILVATPGRLNDFVQRGRVRFNSVRFFVLDEADRMLDMGFLPDVEKMLKHDTMCPTGQRKTLMFSATFPAEIQRLAANYLDNYLFLAVGIVGGACSDVEQTFFEVPRFEKREKLREILRQNSNQLTLVFVEQKRNADFVAAYLSENKFPTTSIHGDRLQSQREAALADFRSGRMPTLIATGVASRGLDIKDVAHVINYDLPNNIDEYVHRIGRTGRVGNKGKATSFYDPDADSPLAVWPKIPSFLGSSGSSAGFQSHNHFSSRDVRRGGRQGGGGGEVCETGGFTLSAPPATTEEDDDGW